MKRRYYFISIPLLILLLPLWMWLAWLLTPKKKLVTAIIDKTVMTKAGQEHASLTWILNHQKFTKTPTKRYKVDNDYFGFFPADKERYRVKGLERFTPAQIDKLSNDCDATYFTDTYGIYVNEWYTKKNVTERSGVIYGGMTQQDVDFLKKMKEKKKLIITEFNTIGSPTADEIRIQFEEAFGIKWTGWIGRYFSSLDTAENKEVPKWLLFNYMAKHQGKWPFKKAGVAFVSTAEEIVILEEGTHLQDPMPFIESTAYGQKTFGLPDNIKYSFWFDVVKTDPKKNKIVAEFDIDATDKGIEVLTQNNIPLNIPAVLMHKEKNDYEFYYFSGDFCDNPLSTSSSYFKGISLFKNFFYKENDLLERNSFFWKFYRPLVTNILKDYYHRQRK